MSVIQQLRDKINIRRAKGLAMSTLWQMMPALSSALLSLAVVRWFSFEVWGGVVAVLVIQQILNVALSWGNKDFLQREFAVDTSNFQTNFSINFYTRSILLILVPIVYILFHLNSSLYIGWFLALVFGRFLQQSSEILVIVNRHYKLSFLLELIVLCTQILIVHYLHLLHEPTYVLPLLAVGTMFKGIFLLIYYYQYYLFKIIYINTLKQSFSFALLAFSGFVISRVDILFLASSVSAETLGKYQIIKTLLWNIQAVANYISIPYAHHFYKGSHLLQLKLSKTLLKLGIIIVPFALAMLNLLLVFVYQLDISIVSNGPMFIYSFAAFILMPSIFNLHYAKKTYTILVINIITAVLLVAFLAVFNRFYLPSIDSILWAISIQQIAITLMFVFASKYYSKNQII